MAEAKGRPSEHNNNLSLKSERLSPCHGQSGQAAASLPDNTSVSSRSATPSSYPGTPPGQSPGSSPSVAGGGGGGGGGGGNRNYSDLMRNLAAKYNNGNPNDYFSASTRNGSSFPVHLDPRFGAFKNAALVAPLATTMMPGGGGGGGGGGSTQPKSSSPSSTAASLKDNALYAATFSMFPPLVDMSSTQALLSMVRTANAHNASQLASYLKGGGVKREPTNENSPLDLSAPAPVPSGKRQRKSLSDAGFFGGNAFLNMPLVDSLRAKRKRPGSAGPVNGVVRPTPASTATATPTTPGAAKCVSSCGDAASSIGHWTVDDVCNYVASIDACAEYAQNFRGERIDGTSLPLLSEEHLTSTMQMKLGPALKLKATLARRIGACVVCSHCTHCHASADATVLAGASAQRPSSSDT